MAAGKIIIKKEKLESDAFNDDEDYGLAGLFGGGYTDVLKDCGLSLERLKLGPLNRKKLIVLSLGGLLCHRVYRNDKSDRPANRAPDLVYGKHLGIYRENCVFCFNFFLVFHLVNDIN